MLRPHRVVILVSIAALVVPVLDHNLHGRRSGSGPIAARVSNRIEDDAGPYPSDWFGMVRAFPGDAIPQGRFQAALAQAQMDRAPRASGPSDLSALAWAQAGPFNIGGRVTALAVGSGGQTLYLGSANGGVFKSTNSGVNWTPVFDAFGIYSIGALALDPTDENLVYVGTGESNGSVDSYDGAGLFRSTDAGGSWDYMGLSETARIARVAIDPAAPHRIFVAAMGTQFSTGPNRGLYRSEDGGAHWQHVLFVNDSTGACDVKINPAHPETVYCATWERVRRLTYRRAFGPGCGIWRSIDHGTTWTRLQNGLPAPSDDVGRIALAIAASRPSMIYAQIVGGSNLGYQGLGMYRSLDGGDSWSRRDITGFTTNFGGFGWYFGDVAVDPTNPESVFSLGVSLVHSTDGGKNHSNASATSHVDQHALWIDPMNPQHLYLGNDGGFYSSVNGGSNWSKSTDLPITQFYAGTIDPSDPNRLLGGSQDNNTLLTSGSPSGWGAILGGDGFQCLVDPTDPNVLFAEYQFCCGGSGPQRSSDGGTTFGTPNGFNTSDRYNWNSPIVMDPNDHNVILTGSQRVYKSIDNGLNYVPICGDLTTNPPALLTFGTIATIEISPARSATYYVGTDDGKVWRSLDSGANWHDISAGLPQLSVTRVTADPLDPGTVYVTLSGFGVDEHLAHVYRSVDSGDTWNSIAGNLPDAPANDILVDPSDHQTLYLATDLGVYATRNLGAGWFPLGQNMPIQTVFDLTLHAPSRTLVAATHGRSQWKLDLSGLPAAATMPEPPPRLALSAPAPNPSHSFAHLVVELSRASRVDISIYDASGRRTASPIRGWMEAGRHSFGWDGRDQRGARVRPGVYFVRADASGACAVRELVRTR